jgi:hypothetical protein
LAVKLKLISLTFVPKESEAKEAAGLDGKQSFLAVVNEKFVFTHNLFKMPRNRKCKRLLEGMLTLKASFTPITGVAKTAWLTFI